MINYRFYSSSGVITTLMMLCGIIFLISCTSNTDEQDGEGTNKEPHIVASSKI